MNQYQIEAEQRQEEFYANNLEVRGYGWCKVMEKPLWWQLRGLSYTASGYGSKIPTSKMVHVNGRWHRVYCCIYSNSGVCYVMINKNMVYVN